MQLECNGDQNDAQRLVNPRFSLASLKLRVAFLSLILTAPCQPAVLDSTTQPLSESDATWSFAMYPSNTLNRRPRGFSGHTSPPTEHDTSIIPSFLRRLSSYTPTLEDSYSRVERMNGNSNGYSMGDEHRHSGVGTGTRRRIFKIIGAIIFVLAGFYFLLPWMSSFSSPFCMCLLC
jgi:hypothetical protein